MFLQPRMRRQSAIASPGPPQGGVYPFMRRIIWLFSLLLVSGLYAQSTVDKQEQETIQRTKRLLASSLDTSLPKVSLEYFLNYESGGGKIRWEVNDCGEQSGNPQADQGRDFPICVEADFDLHHLAVSVMIAVGTSGKPESAPAFFSGIITDSSGKARSLRRLGDLPKELRRPLQRIPKDFPDAAG